MGVSPNMDKVAYYFKASTFEIGCSQKIKIKFAKQYTVYAVV